MADIFGAGYFTYLTAIGDIFGAGYFTHLKAMVDIFGAGYFTHLKAMVDIFGAGYFTYLKAMVDIFGAGYFTHLKAMVDIFGAAFCYAEVRELNFVKYGWLKMHKQFIIGLNLFFEDFMDTTESVQQDEWLHAVSRIPKLLNSHTYNEVHQI